MYLKLLYILISLITISQISIGQLAETVGDASDLGGDCFNITPNAFNQQGAVWYTEPFDLTQYFSLTVDLNLGGNDGGADGVVLVLQQAGLDALGIGGGGLGFEDIIPSLGVEFDTWNNAELADLNQDHMAIGLNGNVQHGSPNNLSGPVSILSNNTNAENGQFITVRLVWNPEDQEVKIFTNCQLRLSASVDLVNDVFAGDPFVYWGFTGATGGASNQQQICFVEAAYLNQPQEFSVCEGDEIELEINSLIPTNIVWSPNENISDLNSATPTVTPASNVTYSVTYEECGETFTDTYIFNVTALDLEPILDQAVCPDEAGVFDAVTNPDYNIVWSSTAEDITQQQFTTPGIHWVEVTDGECTKREEFELTVSPLPLITAPTEVEYCSLDSTLVTVFSPGAELYMPNGTIGSEFYASAEQNYQVVAIDQITGCENSAEVSAIELPLPVIPFLDIYEICPYETLELSLTTDYNVTWSTLSSDNTEVLDAAGDYTVEAELNGCAVENTFTIQVNPLPVSNVPGAYEFCEDDSLIVSNLNPNHTVLWPSGEVSENYRLTDAGTYNVTITDVNTSCLSVETLEVEKKFNPVITLLDSYDLCVNDFIIIEPEVEYATDLLWSTGENVEELRFNEPAEFSVSATNDCRTTQVYSSVQHIICDCIAYVPMAFTPDGDNLNELFLPKLGCTPSEYELTIYNRWGEVMFSTPDVEKGWNGSYQNGAYFVSSDIYTYKLSYTSEQFDGVRTEIKYGTVSVIR